MNVTSEGRFDLVMEMALQTAHDEGLHIEISNCENAIADWGIGMFEVVI